MDQLGANSGRSRNISNGGDTHALYHGHIVDFLGTVSQDLENPHRPEGIETTDRLSACGIASYHITGASGGCVYSAILMGYNISERR
jgi:hypothetical protein